MPANQRELAANQLAAIERRRAESATSFAGNVEDFEPLWDYILVKVLQRDEVTPGGVIMPETYAPKLELKRGKVIKAGAGAYRESGAFIPNPIKEGDTIYMMGHTAPFEVFVKNSEGVSEKHLLLAGRDCVAVEKSKAKVELAEPGKGGE